MKTLRPRSSASTRAMPMATGTTFSTPGTRRKRLGVVDGQAADRAAQRAGLPGGLVLPGLMARMLVPNWVNSERM